MESGPWTPEKLVLAPVRSAKYKFQHGKLRDKSFWAFEIIKLLRGYELASWDHESLSTQIESDLKSMLHLQVLFTDLTLYP